MAITDRTLIRPGVTLIGRYKGTDYRCQVQAFGPGDDRLAFVLPNLPAFTSLSKAATTACKGVPRNGWAFWTIEDGEPAANAVMPDVEVMAREAFEEIVTRVAENIAEAQPRRRKAAPAPGPKMVRCIKRVPNQIGVPEGMIKHYCSSCMAAFVTDERDPQACAVGHPKMQADDLAPTSEEAAVG